MLQEWPKSFAAGIVYISDRLISLKYETMSINQDILDYLQVSLADSLNLRENILAKSQIFFRSAFRFLIVFNQTALFGHYQALQDL